MGLQPDYVTEAIIYAKHILANVKDPKIAVLMQNDDYGKDYYNGFKQGLGTDADKIVKLATYEVADQRSTADHPAEGHRCQRVLQHFHTQVRGAGDQEGRRDRLETGPLHQQRLDLNRDGDEASRFRARQGVISAYYMKDPTDPTYAKDKDIVEWKEFMLIILSAGRQQQSSSCMLMPLTATLVEVLKQCGDDLTRDNIMRQART